MKFKEIINRITGISTPIFGVSWSPTTLEREIARKTLDYLSDKRVLFNPYAFEIPEYCVSSVKDIRQHLSTQLSVLPDDSELKQSFRAMRASCRRFLDRSDTVWTGKVREKGGGVRSRSYVGIILMNALGELRGVFGVHIAKIAVLYGLDVEQELSEILPPQPEEDGA